MFSYLLSTTTVNSTRACTNVHETINLFVLVLVQIPVLVLVHTISTVQSEEVYQYMTPTTEDKIPTLRPAEQVFSLRTQFIPIPHFFTATPMIGLNRNIKKFLKL